MDGWQDNLQTQRLQPQITPASEALMAADGIELINNFTNVVCIENILPVQNRDSN